MKKNGFTLIELLAVIIILGILMIIAIPSVTRYISDSRKNAYIDTAKEIVGGARNLVNEGKLEMYDTDTTYYIESSCIKTENALKSPYGDFTKAYVVVTYDGKGYTYYWTSNDDAGQGIKDVIRVDTLDTDNVESDLKDSDISTLRGIDGRSKTVVISEQNNCEKEGANDAEIQINGETGEEIIDLVCKKATTLHTAECTGTTMNSGCYADGYTLTGSKGTTTITYGTIPNGTPKPGDAYDCKVTQDGDFTERFYYVGKSGIYSTLIYYKNMNDKQTYQYSSGYSNLNGPTTGYQYLPSTSEWNNLNLIAPGTRQILNEKNETTSNGNTLATFTYTNKAARFITYQEIKTACADIDISRVGNLSSCNWFMEDIDYYEKDSGVVGYWLENADSRQTDRVWYLFGNFRGVSFHFVDMSNMNGVRPVITIKTANIER